MQWENLQQQFGSDTDEQSIDKIDPGWTPMWIEDENNEDYFSTWD
jgi:hypothetical protein